MIFLQRVGFKLEMSSTRRRCGVHLIEMLLPCSSTRCNCTVCSVIHSIWIYYYTAHNILLLSWAHVPSNLHTSYTHVYDIYYCIRAHIDCSINVTDEASLHVMERVGNSTSPQAPSVWYARNQDFVVDVILAFRDEKSGSGILWRMSKWLDSTLL